MKKFAKLYESEELGQVLVINGEDSDNMPALAVKFTAEGLGVCEAAFGFGGDDTEHYDLRDKAFELMEAEEAFGMVRPIIEKLAC